MGVVSCCRRLSVRVFVLEVRSWSGNYDPINLYQMNGILCPDKKEQGSKTQLSPSKVPVPAKRRQELRWQLPQAQVPIACPAVMPEGAGHPTQVAFRLLRPPQSGRPGLTDCDPGRQPLLLGRRDRDEEFHCCLKAWTKARGGP